MLHEAHISLFRLRQRRAAYKAEWARRAYADESSPRTIRHRQAQRESTRRYRRGDRSAEYPSNKVRADERREYLNKRKDFPCLDCGGRFHPVAMDFDHVRGVKEFPLSRIGSSIARVEREIAKCDLVCANCHRVRTHKRRLDKAFGRKVEE